MELTAVGPRMHFRTLGSIDVNKLDLIVIRDFVVALRR